MLLLFCGCLALVVLRVLSARIMSQNRRRPVRRLTMFVNFPLCSTDAEAIGAWGVAEMAVWSEVTVLGESGPV